MARRLALLALGLVAVLVVAGQLARAAPGPAVPVDSNPIWSFDGHDIAVQRTLGATATVLVAPATRGTIRTLAAGTLRGWRPGANELLVEHGGRTDVDAEHGGVLATIAGTDASWSPDGARLAYLRVGTLYVSDGRGGDEHAVATGIAPGSDDRYGPVWSPDGTRVAISSGAGAQLAAVRADGSGTQTLFSGAGQNVDPSWSPDSRTLVFESDADGRSSIWQVGADGSAPHSLTGGGADDRFPQLSPATGALLFASDRQHAPGTASRYEYALYVTSGGQAKKLADDVSPTSPARWSPTGDRIAFAAAQECRRFGVYAVALARPARASRQTNICRFEGTAGNDTLRGSPYADLMRGFAGNDRISGFGGNDRIEGNAGNDTIDAGAGDDAVFGGAGDDTILGGPGNDLLVGGPGGDRISGGAGNDRIEARDGFRDTIDCGPGDDTAEVDRLDVVRGCEHVLRP